MDYQPLGRTGVPVSQVGRGAMVPEASGSLGQDDVVQLTRASWTPSFKCQRRIDDRHGGTDVFTGGA
jgi:hypothetical protein